MVDLAVHVLGKDWLVKEVNLFQGGPFDLNVGLIRREQIDGSVKWAVLSWGWAMNEDGEWEREPRPSSRDEEYLARCRFNSPQEAIQLWIDHGATDHNGRETR